MFGATICPNPSNDVDFEEDLADEIEIYLMLSVLAPPGGDHRIDFSTSAPENPWTGRRLKIGFTQRLPNR